MAEAEIESRRRAREVQSGATRAAVLGVSDGLVTNVSLILGVAGASASSRFVLLAGMASLVAGACSMAVGEYVSMAAQVELLQRLLAGFRKHMEAEPEHARQDIEDFIRQGGVSPATAINASKQISLVPDRALAVYARSLGMDPEATGWQNIIFRCTFMGLNFQEAKRLAPAIAEFSELGDYLGIPINDAARMRGDSWKASIQTLISERSLQTVRCYSKREIISD